MFEKMGANPMWQLVVHADTMTKMVFLILLAMSFMCWSVFFYTFILLRIKKRQMKAAFKYFTQVGTMEDLVLVTDKCSGSTAGYFLTNNMQCIKSLLELGSAQTVGDKLGVHQWERVQDSMYNTIDEIVHYEEGMLWLLSTSAGAATLLGLFGTVWGLIHALVSMSEKQTADIAAVAPGLAEALMTTLAGLMVAIPALVMYNYLAIQVRRIEQQLGRLATMFNRAIQILFVW